MFRGTEARSGIRLPACAWLAALAFMATTHADEWTRQPWGRVRTLSHAASPRPGFTRLAPAQTGIAFTNQLSLERQTTNQIYLNGSGVAAADVDGDGRCDVLFAGLSGGTRLYRNLGGWRFEDATAAAGNPGAGLDATGVVFADLDGDGDADLVMNSVAGGTWVFLNDGKGHFAKSAVLNEGRGGMSLALADYDGDGALDLYVANYRPTTLRDQPATQFRVNLVDGKPAVTLVNGQPTTTPDLEGRFTYSKAGGIMEHGEPDVLFHNDGHGRFTPVAHDSGVFLDPSGAVLRGKLFDWGLSVTFRDLNGDGLPDLYVCNDFESPDRIWLNDGKGHFRMAPALAFRNTSKFSMGIDVADVNRDGHDDLFVLDMLSRSHAVRLTRMDKGMEPTPPGDVLFRPQVGRNTLQMARGDGTFAEMAWQMGVAATEWSWTPLFLDVDLDGYEDLLVTAGHGRDDMDLDHGLAIEAARRSRRMPPAEQLALRKTTPRLAAPRQLYRNVGGRGFEEVGKEWGFGEEGVSHGMCVADLDGDGDLDVVVNELNGMGGVYRNEGSGGRVAVRLKGSGGNTRGIGARVTLRGGAVGEQGQEMMAGGRYLSGDDAVRVFASGKARGGMELEVRWRSGKRTVVGGVEADREYEVEEAGAQEEKEEKGRVEGKWFREVAIGHEHHEEEYEEYERQGLLPRKLGRLGPGVGWMDVDGDGREDLVVGSGKGGRLGWWRNDGKGGLEAKEGPMAERDQTGLAGYPVEKGVEVMYGSSNYEEGSNVGGGVEGWEEGKGVEKVVAGPWGAAGAVALVETGGEGELEVFVGTRVNGGRYPEAAGSRVWRRKGGKWEEDAVKTEGLKEAGMVTGAVWTDLDGDGKAELVVATEWGALKVYVEEGGGLKEREMGLGKHRGYWNGVTAGDFDGDGKMDLVGTNWGLNTRHRRQRMYWGDLAGLGQVEVLEAELEGGKWRPVRDLMTVSKALPWAREKYGSHRGWAEAEMEGVLEGRKALVKEVEWMETSVMLNRGDHFEVVALPAEAQRSVGFGVNVGDVDGDGKEDVFVAQNYFGVNGSESRSDAGRGVWLRGDGKGGFEAMESGVEVYGEGRGSALGDYDGDGKVDLVVGENGAGTKVYHNERAKRGLRVGLKGRGRNRLGYGCQVRLEYEGGKLGPAREVHGGSGYWSQDGAVQVMGKEGEVKAVRVKWPGGKETRTELPPNTWDCRIDSSGALVTTP